MLLYLLRVLQNKIDNMEVKIIIESGSKLEGISCRAYFKLLFVESLLPLSMMNVRSRWFAK